MEETHTLIIGAGFSGLAVAACLQKRGIPYRIIEKADRIGSAWRSHYERLHLHTSKGLSHLPFMKFPGKVSRYPSRLEVIEYLEDYQQKFRIAPQFNTEARSVIRRGAHWITETHAASIESKFLVIASGAFNLPNKIELKDIASFTGRVLHSSVYRSGSEFRGERVLVVGFGNSACEIAIDLVEQGAKPSMAVRSPVNVVPREIFGVPILSMSILLRSLPVKIADQISFPLLRAATGNTEKLGLRRPPYGPLEQISRFGKIPLLDIGTLRLIRHGSIEIYPGINRIEGRTIYFADGRSGEFDSMVAAIGYTSGCSRWIQTEPERFEDLRLSVSNQQFFGKDGLYFCGFWISPTGQIREIARDAKKIARDIYERQIHP